MTDQVNSSDLTCGARIRYLRRRTGQTLQVLADKAGISVGFLSQVERDLASPSLGTIGALAVALEVEPEYFIDTPRPADRLTRQGGRQVYRLSERAPSYEVLCSELPGGTLHSLIIDVPSNYRSEIVSHHGEEMLFMLNGHVTHIFGDSRVELGPGDSLHYMSNHPHGFENTTDVPARMMWVGTADPFKEGTNLPIPGSASTQE